MVVVERCQEFFYLVNKEIPVALRLIIKFPQQVNVLSKNMKEKQLLNSTDFRKSVENILLAKPLFF